MMMIITLWTPPNLNNQFNGECLNLLEIALIFLSLLCGIRAVSFDSHERLFTIMTILFNFCLQHSVEFMYIFILY